MESSIKDSRIGELFLIQTLFFAFHINFQSLTGLTACSELDTRLLVYSKPPPAALPIDLHPLTSIIHHKIARCNSLCKLLTSVDSICRPHARESSGQIQDHY
jgi:hypothetical protein